MAASWAALMSRSVSTCTKVGSHGAHPTRATSQAPPLSSVFCFADSQLPPCLHTACASMSLGEVAWLYTSPEQGYGTGGDGGRVPPHAALYWHLQLVGFSAPQPPLPDPAQVKAQAAEAEAAEAEAWARNPPPSWDSRLASAAACRAEGNALFKAGAWAEAGKAYGRGMVHLFLSTDEAKFGGVVESTLREVSRAKALLHLNRSAACLRQGKCTEAEWDANEAVKHCAVSVGALHATREAAEAAAARGGGAGMDPLWDTARKALYRRGCARLAAVRRGLDTALRTLDLPGALDRVRAAKVDMEAAVGVRDFGVVEGPGDRGGASLAPPPCGVDRLVFTPRHPGRSVPQGSVAEALERAQATEVRVRVAMEEEARATASLFRGIFRAPDPRPAEAAAEEEEGGGDSDSSEGVPELGD